MKTKKNRTLLTGILLSLLVTPTSTVSANSVLPTLGENSAYSLTEVSTAGTNTITKYVYDETSGMTEKYYQVDLKKTEYGTGNTTATYTLETPPVKDVVISAKYDSIDTTSTEYTTKYENQVNDLGTVIDPANKTLFTGGIANNQNFDNVLFSNNTSSVDVDYQTPASKYTSISSSLLGGAINNSSVLTAIKADFINNSANTSSSGDNLTRALVTAYGGAIYNSGTITDVVGNFIENSANNKSGGFSNSYTYGGAIANAGTITNLKGDFIKNSATGLKGYTPAYGGAVYNAEKAVIGTIEGDFIENFVSNTLGRSYSNGGAIYNAGSVTDIKGSFIKNSVSAGATNAHGGAIHNTSKGTIETIVGDFIGNSTISTSSAHGGAIYNQGVITTIVGNFIDNKADMSQSTSTGTTYGGAIYNSKTIGSITGDFIGNSIVANKTSSSNAGAAGAALYNSGTITSIVGDFIANTIDNKDGNARGGAILNSKTIESIKGNFIGNSATSANKESVGGAIYNDKAGTITIADGSSFVGNKAYHAGAINNNGGELTVNGTEFTANIADGRGGAIYSFNSTKSETSTVVINNSEFTGNEATWGGALFTANGTFTINNTDFIANKANTDSTTAYGGGAIFNDMDISTLSITGGNFIQNSSGFRGGAIHNTGKMDVTGTTFEGNTAVDAGGAIMTAGTQDVLTDVNFIGNTVTAGDGGAVYQAHHDSQSPSLTIINGLFQDNTAQGAGGALVAMRDLSINGTQFIENKTMTAGSSGGGAIFLGAESTTGINSSSIQNALFSGNTSASDGGAIATRELTANNTGAALNIENSIFENNTAVDNGGAINNNFSNTTIDNAIFEGNKAKNGGAINNGAADSTGALSSLDIANSTFSSNEATGWGGAIGGHGEIAVASSSFDNNEASWGGAIYQLFDKTKADLSLTIEDSSFTNNTALSAGAVGAMGLTEIKNSEFIGNTATDANDDGAGALLLGAESKTTITNSVFSNNTSAAEGGAIATRDNIQGNNKDAELSITSSSFTNNSSASNGGAIYNAFKDVSVSNTDFSGNSSSGNGGAIFTEENNGNGESTDMTITDASFTNNSAAGNGGAIYSNADVTINSVDKDVTFSGNSASDGGDIFMAAAGSDLNIKAAADKTVTIASGVSGNASGFTTTVNGEGTLNVQSYLNNTAMSVNDTATLWLNEGSQLGTGTKVTMNDGTSLNTINNTTDTFGNNLIMNGNVNLSADVNLATGTGDNFSNADTTNATITINEINSIGDNATQSNTNFNIYDALGIDPTTTSVAIAADAAVSNTLTPIRYLQGSVDATTGNVSYAPTGNSYNDFNPAIMASSVAAQLGGYFTQLNSYDEAFSNMDMYMLMTKSQRQAMKNANKYAAADGDLVFDPINTPYTDKAGWFRPYASFGSVGLKNGPKVDNTTYGTYAGLDSELVELGHGWDGMFSVYAGYNGSHQKYAGNSIYQNGGTLGLVGMAYKDNFFTGLTANVGSNIADASTMYGSEDFTMLMTGIASKTGYNWELADGKFIIQPSYLMSYSMVNTFDYTNAAGVRINSDPLHAIQIEPGVKFIGNLKNGWQPYAGVSVVMNILDDTKFKANDVSLPELSVKPYAKYGVGVRKTWGQRFTGFFQTFITSGGRNSVGLQGGFRWTLGKTNKETTKANSTGERKVIKTKA